MVNKDVISESIFRKAWIVLPKPMKDFSNRLFFFIYCCFGLLLFPLYQFQIDPDSISYINIAHLYVIGDFHDALNGYWAPLISWLIVPLLFVKFQPLFSYKIMTFIISCFAFFALRRLSSRFALKKQVMFLVLLAGVPMLLSFVFAGSAPDLLFLCISLYYLYYILRANSTNKVIYGCIMGFLGALLYFSKSYGFYFFVVHFSLFTYINYMKRKMYKERRNILLQYLFGLAIFLLLSGAWIYAISNKYHHFTTSTSGEYNLQLDSIGSQGQPMLSQGLLPLAYSSATSAWDDPSYLTIDYEKSSPLFAWITYQVVHTGENVFRTLYYFELFSLFSIVILLLYAIRYFSRHFRKAKTDIQATNTRFWSRLFNYAQGQNDEKPQSNIIFYSLITMLLYTAGYELLHIEARFLWLDAILLLLLCAYYMHTTSLDFLRNAKIRQFLFLLIFLSFWLYPVALLAVHENEDTDIYMTSKQLQTAYHVKGNIASNDDGDSTNSWGFTLFYTYFLDSKYYGATQKNTTDEELQSVLRKYHIDYYFVWNGVCRLPECKKVTEFEPQFLWTYQSKHLIVYQVENKG